MIGCETSRRSDGAHSAARRPPAPIALRAPGDAGDENGHDGGVRERQCRGGCFGETATIVPRRPLPRSPPPRRPPRSPIPSARRSPFRLLRPDPTHPTATSRLVKPPPRTPRAGRTRMSRRTASSPAVRAPRAAQKALFSDSPQTKERCVAASRVGQLSTEPASHVGNLMP